jgi:CRP-like cAMP-binding protein
MAAPTPEQKDATVERAFAACFPTASPQALQLLRELAVVCRYAPGTAVCTQGEQEERFSLVLEGEVDVYMDQATGRTFVASLEPGSSLGGLEYVTRTPRIADAVAASPVSVVELTFADLDRVVALDPEVLRTISAEVVSELLASQDRFINLSASTGPAPGRQVFVSYARADVDFATQLARGLRRLGVDVWLDVYSIAAGKSWARQVGEALDRCWAMVVVLSPASMASENSDDEWNFYLDKQKPVVPVLLQAVDVPYRLNKLQYVDFTAHPFDVAVTKLAVALRRATAEEAAQPARRRPSAPAPSPSTTEPTTLSPAPTDEPSSASASDSQTSVDKVV